jgi:DNA polymerase III subunit gamma/tau
MPALYRKYRPKKFSEVSGQKHLIQIISNSIKKDRIGHAYLFTGPRGTGKTTLARMFAKTANCTDLQKTKDQIAKLEPCNKCSNCKLIMGNKAIDIIEIDAASHTGVDNIRQLKENVSIPPTNLKKKVYIIDEVHMLSIGAFNALLKTLEEPPAHSIFILATTELHKVPETIISRCQRFDFHRLNQEQIVERLKQICKKEKIEIEEEALMSIALEAEGGMRDAESLLDQIIAIEDKKITANEVNQILGISSQKSALDFVEIVLNQETDKALEKIVQLQNDGINLKNFNKLVLAHLRNILIFKISPQSAKKIITGFSPEQIEVIQKIANDNSLPDLVLVVEIFQTGLNNFKESFIPQLPLEMAVINFSLQRQDQENSIEPEKKIAEKNLPEKELETTLAEQPKPLVAKKKSIENTPPEKKEETPKETPKKEMTSDKKEEKKITTSKNDCSIEEILEKWSEILEGIKPYNHSIHAFLKNCTPLGIKEGKLYIKTKYDFYKEKLNEPENQLTIQKVIDKIIQCQLIVTFVTDKEAVGMKLESTSKKSAKHNVLHDAMQVIGGRIVE